MTLLSGSLSLMQVNEKYWRSPKPLELYYLLDRPEELQSPTPQPSAAQAPTSQLTTAQPPAPQTSEWCQEWLLRTFSVNILKTDASDLLMMLTSSAMVLCSFLPVVCWYCCFPFGKDSFSYLLWCDLDCAILYAMKHKFCAI